MLYPLSVFFPVIIKEALFLPKSSRSLCVFVHILSCLPKGVPLQLSTFSHSTFFSCWNIPVSIHARSSISCFGKNPPLTPRLLQLVPHFSAHLHSKTFWKSCLYWLSLLPYLALTPFWLPSRKPSLHWNSFSQGHRWPPCRWILLIFLILLSLL